MIDATKDALKKCLPYVGNSFSDPLLQAICLNNLAGLERAKRKPWKSLKYSLRGVEIMQSYIQNTKSKDKDKSQRQENAILLVVLLIYSKKNIADIMRK